MRITPLVVLTWIFGSAQSQWVPEAYTIPDQMLTISPDGTVAIGSAGIYTQTSGSWTLAQCLSFSYFNFDANITLSIYMSYRAMVQILFFNKKLKHRFLILTTFLCQQMVLF